MLKESPFYTEYYISLSRYVYISKLPGILLTNFMLCQQQQQQENFIKDRNPHFKNYEIKKAALKYS